MTIFKRTLQIIIAVMVLTLTVSCIIEMNALNTSRHNILTATRIAGKYAVESFEITQFSGFDDGLGNEWQNAEYSTNYDISELHNQSEYEKYLNSIENQGTALGINNNGSDFKATIEFLREELNTYKSGGTSSVISPFAFSWTFVEEERLKQEFDQTIKRIIQSNYNPDNPANDTALAFSGRNVVRIASTDAKIINGPTLLNLETRDVNTNPETYKTYLSLFGTNRQEAMNMYGDMNSVEKMYNYVIVYDVQYTVNWEHHTITPFFNGLSPMIPREHLNENNQIIIELEPLVYTRRYVVTN